jgi:type I restriction enzyme M protein
MPAGNLTVDIHDIAGRLWETADELRANSHLKAAEYAIPVLGLIFLKFADSRFTQSRFGLTNPILLQGCY